MEFQVGVDELNKALARAQGIIDRKPAHPMLSNVLIEAKKTPEGGRIYVTAYDLDVGLAADYPAEVVREGAIAVSAKQFFEIVRSLPESVATVRRGPNERIEVSSGTAEFRLVGHLASDYPALPLPGTDALVPLESALLLEMIDRTHHAMSTDDTRYSLMGVYFDPRETGVRMVATDGHRLAMVERPLQGRFGLGEGAILPRKGLLELRRLLSEDPALPGELGFVNNMVVFRRQGLVLLMRLIDASFPDYEQVIPQTAPVQLQLPRARLAEVLRRVSLLSAPAGLVRFELTDGRLTFVAQSEQGDARESLPVDFSGKSVKVGFNAKYLLDVLTVLDCDLVRLELADDMSPGLVRPVDDASFVAVVMPMRM